MEKIMAKVMLVRVGRRRFHHKEALHELGRYDHVDWLELLIMATEHSRLAKCYQGLELALPVHSSKLCNIEDTVCLIQAATAALLRISLCYARVFKRFFACSNIILKIGYYFILLDRLINNYSSIVQSLHNSYLFCLFTPLASVSSSSSDISA